jgi:hypothetical protein
MYCTKKPNLWLLQKSYSSISSQNKGKSNENLDIVNNKLKNLSFPV